MCVSCLCSWAFARILARSGPTGENKGTGFLNDFIRTFFSVEYLIQTLCLQAAQILGTSQPFVWCKVRGRLLQNQLSVFGANDDLAAAQMSKGYPEVPEFPFDDDVVAAANGSSNGSGDAA
jgi:hypothetical protein